MKKFFLVLVVALIAFALVVGCNKGKKDDTIKIGLSFSDFAVERWPREQADMTKLAYDAGAQCISQVANHDAKLQNDQIENMVLQGVDVIIIVAEDGAACATAVDAAADAGIPCISYDRLIKSNKVACYISFDNTDVGRNQADGVLKVVNKGKFVMLGGSPTDNNAVLVRNGQMEKVQPFIDSGDIEIVADQWVDNWDPANALKIMENILTAQNNDIDAVVASNDGTALGALQAMKAQGLSGKVPISGQDATAAGCKSIVEGELSVTVFKDTRLLAPMAIDMALKFAKGETVDGLVNYKLSDLTLDENLTGEVPCKFLKVVQVNKDNVYDVVVKSGFQPWEDVYKDIPASKRPPKP
jgi:D-xylose transport system substrate-binding protein